MRKKLTCLFLALVMVLSSGAYNMSSVYAAEEKIFEYETNIETTQNDINDLKELLSRVERYIDFTKNSFFDEEKARLNNESEDIIQIGLAYNEMYLNEKQGNYEKVNRRKRAVISGLTHYGNWCGKGNNGKKPIDILDAQCKKHDLCYEKKACGIVVVIKIWFIISLRILELLIKLDGMLGHML